MDERGNRKLLFKKRSTSSTCAVSMVSAYCVIFDGVNVLRTFVHSFRFVCLHFPWITVSPVILITGLVKHASQQIIRFPGHLFLITWFVTLVGISGNCRYIKFRSEGRFVEVKDGECHLAYKWLGVELFLVRRLGMFPFHARVLLSG